MKNYKMRNEKNDRAIDIIFYSMVLTFFLLISMMVSAQEWNEVTTPGLSPTRMDFVTDNDGFAIMQMNSFSVGRCGVYGLFKTSDGGHTWNKMITPTGFQLWMMPTQIDFVTEDIGFVEIYSRDLFKTIDGGITWTNISPDSLASVGGESLSFIDEYIGYYGKDEHLYKTTDGGLTWTITKSGDIINNFLPTSKYIGELNFYDENNGAVVITISTTSAPWSESKVCVTSDGGITWNINNNSVYLSHITKIRQVSPSTTYFLTPFDTLLYRSTDSGLNWEEVNLPVNFIHYVSSFDFRDENEGYLNSGGWAFHKTINGGQTWELIDSNGVYVSDFLLTPNSGYSIGGYETFLKLDELTSIPTIEKEMGITVYPTLSSGVVTLKVDTPQHHIFYYEVVNIDGKLIKKGNGTYKKTIDIGTTKGLHIIRIKIGNSVSSHKIIIT